MIILINISNIAQFSIYICLFMKQFTSYGKLWPYINQVREQVWSQLIDFLSLGCNQADISHEISTFSGMQQNTFFSKLHF